MEPKPEVNSGEVARVPNPTPEESKKIHNREFDLLRKIKSNKEVIDTDEKKSWPSELLAIENKLKTNEVSEEDESDFEYTPGEETKADLWGAIAEEHNKGGPEWAKILNESIQRDEGVIKARRAFIEELLKKGDQVSLKEAAELMEKNRRLELKLKIDKVEYSTDFGDFHEVAENEHQTKLEAHKQFSNNEIATLEGDIATIKSSINRLRKNSGDGYTVTMNNLKDSLSKKENALAIEKSLTSTTTQQDRTYIKDRVNETEVGRGTWEDTKVAQEEPEGQIN
jgi:hypothetical protein